MYVELVRVWEGPEQCELAAQAKEKNMTTSASGKGFRTERGRADESSLVICTYGRYRGANAEGHSLHLWSNTGSRYLSASNSC